MDSPLIRIKSRTFIALGMLLFLLLSQYSPLSAQEWPLCSHLEITVILLEGDVEVFGWLHDGRW